jgi:hypothetical protein
VHSRALKAEDEVAASVAAVAACGVAAPAVGAYPSPLLTETCAAAFTETVQSPAVCHESAQVILVHLFARIETTDRWSTQLIPQEALTSYHKVDRCKPLHPLVYFSAHPEPWLNHLNHPVYPTKDAHVNLIIGHL